MARWNAVIAGDLKSAYELVSPAGRSVVTLEGFKNSMRPGFHKAARVEGVKCESAEVCDVMLEIEYEYAGTRAKSRLPEKWVKQEGNWWYLLR